MGGGLEAARVSQQGLQVFGPESGGDSGSHGGGLPLVEDVLSNVLRSVRLSASLQFCFMPSGVWQTDGVPRMAKAGGTTVKTVPFHIVAEGSCWMKMDGQDYALEAGDVLAFPFGTGHQLGSGHEGRLVTPILDLPPKPWRSLPVLRYGTARERVRLLCGYLYCDAMSFGPLRDAMPKLLHVRTRGANESGWLRHVIAQIVSEVDEPRPGGLSILERLTEIAFIELLRHHIAAQPGTDTSAGGGGWLAALADPALSRCLALIHAEPLRAWSVAGLSTASGLSRSTLAERFEAVLGVSPMRYVREWRLSLARVALGTTRRSIAAIAEEAGYGTEAAFNRAFARAYGTPPAAWRHNAQRNAAG
jgi:AraC-like DNA-binding protein